MRTFEPMKMKHIFLISLMSMITLWANGQNDQTEKGQKSKFAGMRMEVAESETDNGEYSIFTLEDEDGHFGFPLAEHGGEFHEEAGLPASEEASENIDLHKPPYFNRINKGFLFRCEWTS